MQLHKAVYLGGQSINSALYPREPLVHLIADIAEFKMHQLKLGIHLFS